MDNALVVVQNWKSGPHSHSLISDQVLNFLFKTFITRRSKHRSSFRP